MVAAYQFFDDSGGPIDSRFEVQTGELILQSRGGASGTPHARNTQYNKALRMLLDRISRSELTLLGAWVDSSRVQELPLEQRQILFPQDRNAPPGNLFTMLSRRMAQVGQDPSVGGRGNSTKRVLFAFGGNPSEERIVGVVGFGRIPGDWTDDRRIPLAELNKVRTDHIWLAVQHLLSDPAGHTYGESTHYDVIAEDGTRLPPKAVFGIAASFALGFQVRPRHFNGGMRTRCFRKIEAAGYSILSKNDHVGPAEIPPDTEDRIWVEGNPRAALHLRRERGSGVSAAKKLAFKLEQGRLTCEHCGLDPAVTYEPGLGDACIEVHHKIPLSKGLNARVTRLEDLQCVCANCHRIIHRQLRNASLSP